MLSVLGAYRKIQVFDLGAPRRATWYHQNIKKRNNFELQDEEEKQAGGEFLKVIGKNTHAPIHMTTLIKQFIEAERSGNWDLHITTIQQMLPFFRAAGHFFYAKCAHLYMQDTLNLKDSVDPIEYEKFTKDGYFTIRSTDKFWSGIWSNQTIEQTLMKTMKSSGELTRGRGITESVLTGWTLGMIHLHNICEEE
ncbi:hypothetical protein AVEN_234798-1 [Araneus ventricosus]|uniref:Uncharacterized protein n=1 Tax=Araneus ventricosus TaxID=182803 RepID=A0A4Y2F7Q8_ARAVE|nr:hypothetical protein AVEN_234798-1 [Araneus ventricosus]